MNGWIQTFSGRAVTPLYLQPDQVVFEDIPHALAQKVRFNGHLREMGYSVAQHCVLGAEQIFPYAISAAALIPNAVSVVAVKLKLAFLLHEVSEVYLPDITAPIKPFVFVRPPSHVLLAARNDGIDVVSEWTWSQVEDRQAQVIFERWASPISFRYLEVSK